VVHLRLEDVCFLLPGTESTRTGGSFLFRSQPAQADFATPDGDFSPLSLRGLRNSRQGLQPRVKQESI